MPLEKVFEWCETRKAHLDALPPHDPLSEAHDLKAAAGLPPAFDSDDPARAVNPKP